jgi:hypothetical protein
MAVTQDFCAHFRRVLLEDEVMRDLWEQRIDWGMIPGILDDPRDEKRRATASASAWADLDAVPAAPTTPVLGPRQETECPGAPLKLRPEVQVPAFSPGIKTIILRNLPRDISPEVLRSVLEKYGPVRDVYIPRNMDRASPYFGTIKGFALIKFLSPADSARAYESEYGRLTIGKNNITVEFAKEDR